MSFYWWNAFVIYILMCGKLTNLRSAALITADTARFRGSILSAGKPNKMSTHEVFWVKTPKSQHV